MLKHLHYLLIILLFSLIGMKALVHPGLFTAHDIWHQVVRFYYYIQAVNDGQFPPYWIGQLANSFGYPLFFFSYHLPWLIGSLLVKIGINIPDAIKILFFLSYFSSGIIMYFFVNRLLNSKVSALLSAILYLWLPYHFLIIFVGASMGIAFIFTFLPLFLMGIHLTREGSSFGIPICAVGLSGIILSHIMHLVFLMPLILFFLFWEISTAKKKINFLRNICFGIVLGILISSFYLMPAAYYNKFTRAHSETGFSELYKRNFINLSQLVYSKWSFSPIVNNAKSGEVSFQLGIAQWLAIFSLAIFVILRKLNKEYFTLSIYLILAFIVNVFLMIDQSKFIWQFIAKLTTVDFPFRLILPAAFVTSIMAGLVLTNFGKKLKIISFILLTLVTIYTNRNHLNVNQYTDLTIKDYLDLETEITTNTFNEYLPARADSKLLGKPWNEATGEYLTVFNLNRTTNYMSFDIEATKEAVVSIGQFNFPGQNLYVDNQMKKSTIDKEGRISFTATPGIQSITIKYQETLLIKLSKILTVIGILVALFLFLKGLRKKLTLNQIKSV